MISKIAFVLRKKYVNLGNPKTLCENLIVYYSLSIILINNGNNLNKKNYRGEYEKEI